MTKDTRRRLLELRTAIAAMPTREERIGGQRAQYVQHQTVLDYVDAVLAALPAEPILSPMAQRFLTAEAEEAVLAYPLESAPAGSHGNVPEGTKP